MLRSIPIKLSRKLYYNTYFSSRKCHLCCIYSLAVTPTRRLIITGVFLSWLHPVAATPKSNLIFTPANATGDETREVILVREVTRAMCPAVEDAGAPKVVAGRCSSRVPLVHNCNCNVVPELCTADVQMTIVVFPGHLDVNFWRLTVMRLNFTQFSVVRVMLPYFRPVFIVLRWRISVVIRLVI